MATLTNPEGVKDLIRKRGKDEGLEWKLIYQYVNVHNGETLFAIYNEDKYCDIYHSPYVTNAVLLMERGWLTKEGADFMGVNQEEFNGAAGYNSDPDRKYYRTVIQVEVLSSSPYEFTSLEDTAYDVMNGDCSGKVEVVSSEEVDAKRMAELLMAQGSDPQFLLSEEDLESLDERLE